MEPILVKAEIVLMAQEHDLNLIDWLNKTNALEQKDSNIVQLGDFSSIDTTKFSIDKMEQELTISAKNFEQDGLVEAQTIANRYIKTFSNLSYNAIVFNFAWEVKLADADKLKNTFITNQDQIDKIFSGYSNYDIGGLLTYQDNTFTVALMIVPRQNNPIFVTFIYRLDTTDVNQISESISCFTKAVENTQNITKELLGG